VTGPNQETLTMKFRTSPLLAVAALLAVSAAAPAMAGDFDMGGIPVVGPLVGSSTSNSVNATNVAAGIGNVADQDIDAKQSGGRVGHAIRHWGGGKAGVGVGGPLVTTNTAVGTNVAAGIGNEADQDLHLGQKGGPGVGLGAVTNSLNALNLAAGINNQASQTIHSKQK
jgi:hypothetical protein